MPERWAYGHVEREPPACLADSTAGADEAGQGRSAVTVVRVTDDTTRGSTQYTLETGEVSQVKETTVTTHEFHSRAAHPTVLQLLRNNRAGRRPKLELVGVSTRRHSGGLYV